MVRAGRVGCAVGSEVCGVGGSSSRATIAAGGAGSTGAAEVAIGDGAAIGVDAVGEGEPRDVTNSTTTMAAPTTAATIATMTSGTPPRVATGGSSTVTTGGRERTRAARGRAPLRVVVDGRREERSLRRLVRSRRHRRILRRVGQLRGRAQRRLEQRDRRRRDRHRRPRLRALDLGDQRGALAQTVAGDARDPGRDPLRRGWFHRVFERDRHRLRRREAPSRILGERAGDDAVEVLGHGRDESARRLERARTAVGRDVREEAFADERLPQHDRRRVDVGASIERPPRSCSRAMYAIFPFDLAAAGLLKAARRLGDAEVEDARDAVGADEHVLRRDVAVDEPERRAVLAARLVGRVKAAERAGEDRDGDVRRHAVGMRSRNKA